MLYIAPVPIGNLEDITLRVLKLFQEVKWIMAEDSRKTKKLFKLLNISNSVKFVDITRNHKLNYFKIKEVLEIAKNEKVLLVSDSGTPGISDPGFEVVKMAIEDKVPYTTLPGATSLVPAVINSGLIFKEFIFVGFLPLKKGRQKKWQEIAKSEFPVVLFESVHRLEKFCLEAKNFLEPNRWVCFNREISKLNESIYRLQIKDLDTADIKVKGEFVIVIQGFLNIKEADA